MTASRIVYTRHAEEMLVERGINRGWVELTVRNPEIIEPDPVRSRVLRAFRRIPERSGRFLRVVYVQEDEIPRIVTAFFDRKRRHV